MNTVKFYSEAEREILRNISLLPKKKWKAAIENFAANANRTYASAWSTTQNMYNKNLGIDKKPAIKTDGKRGPYLKKVVIDKAMIVTTAAKASIVGVDGIGSVRYPIVDTQIGNGYLTVYFKLRN